MDKKKPIPKNQKEISKSKHTAYDKTRGNPNIETNQRAEQNSFKEDTVKPLYIGLEDIDSSIIYYFNNIIKPNIVQKDEIIPVPIIYGSPERWKSYQKDGYYRDKEGKIMAPLIMFRRTSLEKDRSRSNKLDANNPNNYSIVNKTYSPKDSYSNFDILNNRKPEKTYYATVIPDYINITYNCVIFTNYVEQLNKIIEAIQYSSDSYWGDPERFQFNAQINSFDVITELSEGKDRIVKSSFSIQIKGYIIPDNIQKNINSIKKFRDKSNIIFGIETDYKPNESLPLPLFSSSRPTKICKPVIIRDTNNSITLDTIESGLRYIIPAAGISYIKSGGLSDNIYRNVINISSSYLVLSGSLPRFTIYENNGSTVNSYRDITYPFFTLPSSSGGSINVNNSEGQLLFIISSSFNLPPVQLKYINSGGINTNWLNFNITQSNGYTNLILTNSSLIPSFSVFRSGSNSPTASLDILNPNYILYPINIITGLSGTQISTFDEFSLPNVVLKYTQENGNIDSLELSIEKISQSLQCIYEQPGDQYYPIPRFPIYYSDGTIRTYRTYNSSYTESNFKIFSSNQLSNLIFVSSTGSYILPETNYFYYNTNNNITELIGANEFSGSYLTIKSIGDYNNPIPRFVLYHFDSSSYKSGSIIEPNIYLEGVRIQNSNNSYSGTIKDASTASIPDTWIINSGSTYSQSIASAITASISNIRIDVSGSSSIIRDYQPSQSQAVYEIPHIPLILPNSSGSSSVFGPIDIRNYASGICYNFGKDHFWSGQTVVYRSGDEGTLLSSSWFNYDKPKYPVAYSDLENFYTLSANNIHGNTRRFTDRSGFIPSSSGNRLIQDHAYGTEWYLFNTLPNLTWNQAIDSGSSLNVEGNDDWYLPTYKLFFSILDMSLSDNLNHEGFNISGLAFWTSTTTSPSSTTNAIRWTNGFVSQAKTNTNRTIFVRKFI